MLNFDSLDQDNVPDEDYRPGRRFVSTSTVLVAGGFFVVVVIVVGLLCGLLGSKLSCDSGNLESTHAPNPTTAPALHSTIMTTSAVPVTQTVTIVGSSTPPSASWFDPRLPQTLKPSHYNLEIQIDLEERQRFEGTMTVFITCNNATDVILMHAKDLNMTPGNARLEKAGDSGASVPAFLREPWMYAQNQYLVVELDGPLATGEEYVFSIRFEAPLKDGGLVGLYRSSYSTADGETRYVAATFFAPTNARMAFPCFDEPAMKATFNITIIHHPDFTALSNMPLIGNETNSSISERWVKSVFARTPPMSTYIVCYVVVCDFAYEELVTNNNVTFRVWARRDALSSVHYALEKGVIMLDYYDYYFGTKFPLPKMDMIAIPNYGVGAMENWGLITYKESALLYTPGVSAASDLQFISFVMGHELAHQWFGNLVSFEWWNDLWLKEGFASYVLYIGINITEPEWGMLDQFVASDYYTALEADATTTSRPIIVDVYTADDINQQYDAIAYNKGSSIIRMIQNFLGENTFRRGLQIYLDRYKYDNAENTDLWNCFTEAAEEHNVTDVDVKKIMDTWTLQMGYPIVNISRDYSATGPSCSAHQNRFLIDPEANTTSRYDSLGYTWHVPLRYTTRQEGNFVEPTLRWLSAEAPISISLPETTSEDWLLVNVNAYGYYRVNYDGQNWDLLIRQLLTSHQTIPISNRASLIGDALNLAQAGALDYGTALNLSLYLSEERDFVPWKMAELSLEYVDRMLCRSATYGAFQTYMRRLVTPFYNAVGWDDASSGHREQLGRVVAISVSCHYSNKECISTATSLFQAWMRNSSVNTVPPNQKYNVYCTAIAAGGQSEWYFAFDQYETTRVASEKAILLQTLACSRHPWILSQYLEMTLDRIESQDAANVVVYVASNPIGYDLAWEFFRTNWAFFRQAYGSSLYQFANLISHVTAYFNTDYHLEELLNFIADHPDQGTGERALSQAVAQTQANIRWMQKFREDVGSWLQMNQ